METDTKLDQTQTSPDDDFGDVLLTSMEAGHILLENGAEVTRVEETMLRISRYFGLKDKDFFVLSNGIFTTGGSWKSGHQESFARVQHIPMHAASLDKVVAINQLARDVEAGKYKSLDEINDKLKEIRSMPGKSHLAQIIAAGVGAGGFSILFGGNILDGAAAGVAGLILYLFLLKLSIPVLHFSKITENLCGGVLVTLLCMFFYKIGFGHDLYKMVVGAVMPLVPGIAFVNGIRDIADKNYIAGIVRILDAVLVFVCIAVGVGIVFTLHQQITGGLVL